MKHELAVVGAGNMAEAILKGCLDQKIIEPEKIIVVDPVETRREMFQAMGMHTSAEIKEAVTSATQIMLAVKPQIFPEIASEFAGLDHDPILISIMAGLSSQKLNQMIGNEVRLIRVMPNTPLLVGLGMSGVALGVSASSGDEALTMKLFSSAGEVVFVEEEAIDSITAISGSGPAYLFYLAEAMMEAAQELGMNAQQGELLVQQTIAGAAKLLSNSDDEASLLRRKVSSPGGTTEAAINRMESKGVREGIKNGIFQAAQRSRELGAE